MKKSMAILGLAVIFMTSIGCTGGLQMFKSFQTAQSDLPPEAPPNILKLPSFDLQFEDGANIPLYSTSQPTVNPAELKVGASYSLSIMEHGGAPSDYRLTITDDAVVNPSVVNGVDDLSVANLSYDSLLFSQVGDYRVTIKAIPDDYTPNDGRIVSKSVILRVVCDQPETFSDGQISVGGPSLNTFTYTLTSAAIANFDCAFDFNGDAIIDTAFGSCASRTGLTNHVGSRKISAFARSKICNNVFRVEQTVPLADPPKGDKYLVGDIAPQAPNADPRLTLRHFSSDPNLVRCYYDMGSGVWSIQGLYKYDMASSLVHGLAVNVRLTPQGTEPTLPLLTDADGSKSFSSGVVSSMGFSTDRQLDSSVPLIFVKNSNMSACTATISMTSVKTTDTGPCNGSNRSFGHLMLRTQGQYSCPGLSSGTGPELLDVTSGEFKCETNVDDVCPPPVQAGDPPPQF